MADLHVQNLSLTARILVNAEALNMAESVGNYTRHRKAPAVVPSENGYSIIYAPAVSGESLAHTYQALLAKIAAQKGLPVTEMDVQGFFMKFSDENIIKSYYVKDLVKALKAKDENEALKKLKEMSPADVEKTILKTSVVADVGGFLYMEKKEKKEKKTSEKEEKGPVKRTSAIRFAFLIPALDALITGGASLYPQLHVRYTPEAKEGEQVIIYVESGSALYTLTAQLVISDIGRVLMDPRISDEELEKQRISRVEAAIDALTFLVDGVLFGAKRSRYMPQWDVRSILVAFSRGPVEYNVSPGLAKDYMVKSYERAVALAKSLGNNLIINLYGYNGEAGYLQEPVVKPEVKNVTFEKTATPAEALSKAKEKIMSINKPLG
ncbi:DevR family CRISPR-associated autoregulator [Thermosphaera sp.]